MFLVNARRGTGTSEIANGVEITRGPGQSPGEKKNGNTRVDAVPSFAKKGKKSRASRKKGPGRGLKSRKKGIK